MRSSTSPTVRVITDVAALDKEFDYVAPEGGGLEVGMQVRVDLGGRRVGGWVTATGVETNPDLQLRSIARVRGFGPPPDVVDLASWAAWRWAGRRAALLSTASANRAVPTLPRAALRPPKAPWLLGGRAAPRDLGRARPSCRCRRPPIRPRWSRASPRSDRLSWWWPRSDGRKPSPQG